MKSTEFRYREVTGRKLRINKMSTCQKVLTRTFRYLLAREASAEIIFEVLMDEAGSMFPNLKRKDLEAIIVLVLEEARQEAIVAPVRSNVLEFPVRNQHVSNAY